MAWSDKFSHPIKWGQRKLDTLQDARLFIQKAFDIIRTGSGLAGSS